MNISEQILLNKAPQISSSDGETTVDGILQTFGKPGATLDSAWAVETEERMSAFKAGMLEVVDSDEVFAALTTYT